MGQDKMRVSDGIRWVRDCLASSPIDCRDPLLHAKQVLESVLGVTTSQLYLRWEEEIPTENWSQLEEFVRRRCSGEPFQYIVGYEWFWKYRFKVGPGVLIPRPETEVLLESLFIRAPSEKCRVAELGPGSGNIGISALLERRDWEWFGFEKNPESYRFLLENLKNLMKESVNYHSFQGDFFELAPQHAPFDILVANPPYVPVNELDTLSREVSHEPPMALSGGEEGLQVLFRLIDCSAKLLRPGGLFFSEIDPRQSAVCLKKMEIEGFQDLDVIVDYTGRDRVIFGVMRWTH